IILSDATSPTPAFVAPDVLVDTPFDIMLEVSDGYVRDTDTDMVTITVLFVNQPPVADAGGDQNVYEGDLVQLDGSGSYDPDGQAITYLWTAPPEIILSDPSIVNPTFTAPDVTMDQVFTISLTVDDQYGGRDTAVDEVDIQVLFVNQPPIADAGDDQTVDEGVLVQLDGSGSWDPDGQELLYSWAAPPEIILSDPSIVNPTFIAPDVTSDQVFTISLTVDDQHGGRDTAVDEVDIQVLFVNQPPVADAGEDQTVDEGDLVQLDGSDSYDPDGQLLTYLWTAPPEIVFDDPTLVAPTFTAPDVMANTNYTVTLEVNDNFGRAVDTDDMIVTVLFVNQPPVADAGEDQIVPEQTIVQLDGSGSYDPDNGTLSYFWQAPAGINLSNPYVVNPHFYAPNVTANVQYLITLTVNDNQSRASDSDEVMITVEFVNQPPVANAGNDQTVDEGEIVYLDGSDSYDPDGQTLTYFWTAPPEIVLSDPTAESPHFTAPDVTMNTVFNIILEVSDGNDRAVDTDDVNITVLFINQPPVANAGDDQFVYEGDLVQLDGSGSYDPDGQTLYFTWDPPYGIQLSDIHSPMPTFTAPGVDEDEEYIFELMVQDNYGARLFDEDEVMITVLKVVDPNPVCAVDPVPPDGCLQVPLDAMVGWSYYHDDEYSLPAGFRIFMAYDEDLTDAYEGYVPYDGEGEYLIDHPIDFTYETQYFWQVVPTTEGSRGDAVDCPIWNFTTVDLPTFTVSGYVGIHAVVDLGGGYASNSSGMYSIVVGMGSDLTLTPVLEGFDFDPESVTFYDIQANIIQNFTVEMWCPLAAANGQPTGENIPVDVEELTWDPPAMGVMPTFYYVSLSDHPEFVNPILDEIEVYETYVSLANINLDYDTVYWVEVITNYTPPGYNYGCNGPAYVWSFRTETLVDADPPIVPQATLLMGNYPNPFNPSTVISFSVREGETACLEIYNLKGQIMESKVFSAGKHEYSWQPQDESTGVFFYRLHSKSYSHIKKMLMLK
ncbi:MAG: T9SS type A sorting domain-containing protein, partial [Candidatus Cloacimonetes bacterium]|nr:T9SS type A sorting domain-containing protein [Candidatus Cloacimonadota bacterium]